MTVEELASAVLEACDQEGAQHMLTGAFATSLYGIPRSTKDVDVVLDIAIGGITARVAARLGQIVEFDRQAPSDTLTWGRRIVGVVRQGEPFKVELFELFDAPFVLSQFQRKRQLQSRQLGRAVWVPTPEDVIVQKLRWGRSKDLDDARDVLAVQGTERLDMAYIESWCAKHHTTDRLRATLAGIPPL